jgi:hypothetical protein
VERAIIVMGAICGCDPKNEWTLRILFLSCRARSIPGGWRRWQELKTRDKQHTTVARHLLTRPATPQPRQLWDTPRVSPQRGSRTPR